MPLEDAKSQVDTAFTRTTQRGYAFENAFGGATSFLRRTYTKNLTGVDLAVTGVPFDQAVTHRAGTRFGPRAIREASSLMPYDPPYGWPTNPLQDMNIIDYGDCAFDYAKTADFPETLTAHIRKILNAGAGTVTLGGDHYITLPILKAYAEKFGPLSVVHFDAHSDLWPDDDMTRIDHGTMMYKAVKLGYVNPARSVQVGIRTTTEDYLGFTVIDAREVHERGTAAAVAKSKDIVDDTKVYLTFDIDALDPAFAPGTGTPEIGGLASWQAQAILRSLRGVRFVGMDLVEVAPAYDVAEITALAGATMVWEYLALINAK
ncbi:MAG: agmatinase [Pseudorhodobacter sp.]|nr:agmatinase [Pseudorhodobacter sp.]